MIANNPTEGMRPRIALGQLDVLMTYLLRSSTHFQQARLVLKDNHFRHDYETGYRVIWIKALEYYDRYRQQPPREILEPMTLDELEHMSGGGELMRAVSQDVESFFDACYATDMEQLRAPYGFDLLKSFLHERNVLDPAQEYFTNLNGHVPKKLDELMKDLVGRHISVETIAASQTIGSLIPTKLPSSDQLAPIPTGLDFFDTPLGGGRRRGEAIGLLGALKAGKTSLGVQASISAATCEIELATKFPGYVPETSVYVTYEQDKLGIQRKAIAYAASIPFDRVTLYDGWLAELSTIHRPESLLEYERQMNSDPVGELERYCERVVPLDDTWHIVDHSGTDGSKAGEGYIDEICAALERLKQEGVKKFGLVVVDYALLACRRYIRAKGWDETKRMRTYINGFADDCRRMIAQAYNCSVLVLHQLSGEANRMSPTARVSHANAAEGTLFAENVSYCFELQTKDEQSGCVVWRCSATRHSETPSDPYILRYTDFGALEDASARYVIDPISHRIVQRDVAGAWGVRPRPAAPSVIGSRSARDVM